MKPNPFKPSFGSTPPVLVGRDQDLADFAEGLEDGPGAPGRTMVFTGARGVGKTVMLSEVAVSATRRGWIAADVTSTAGMLQEILEQAEAKSGHLSENAGRRVSGVQISGFGITTESPDAALTGWRSRISDVLETLARNDTGLLITVDEVHRTGIAELRELAANYQHFVREQRDVALVLAGLPSAVSDLLSDDVLTFLRRADLHKLAAVDLAQVETAFAETITENGRLIRDPALSAAASATRGYPFLIQLVGYQIWRQNPDREEITLADVQAGAAAAQRRLGATVHEASLADLSQVDRTFLAAMATSEGPIKTSTVAANLGVDVNYASQYRIRLIEAGLITPSGHGYIDFALPYLREYLKEHAATLGLPGARTPGSQI